MVMVPEAKEQHCAGGWGAGEGPSAEAEQGQPPTEHRGNHQKSFHKEHCDLDLVSRCSR